MTQEVSSAKDRRRYGINRTFLSFCFTEHKVAFNEAAKAARAVGWEVVRKMGGRCRLRYMPTVAASAFNDWEPVDPKDAITQLGDTLREDA